MLEQLVLNVVHSAQFQALEVLSAYFIGDAVVKTLLSLHKRPSEWTSKLVRPFDVNYLANFLGKYVSILGPFVALAVLGQLEHMVSGTELMNGVFWAAIGGYTAQELGDLIQSVREAFPGAAVPESGIKP